MKKSKCTKGRGGRAGSLRIFGLSFVLTGILIATVVALLYLFQQAVPGMRFPSVEPFYQGLGQLWAAVRQYQYLLPPPFGMLVLFLS